MISASAMVGRVFLFWRTSIFWRFGGSSTGILRPSFLINYVNQTNRKIAYFFDAIKNEDFTLRFPEKLSVKSLEELNHSLNMLNAMIQDIHLKKQAQEQYYQEILRQADIGILTINHKGHILYANPTVQRLLNYSPLNHIKQLNQVDKELYAIFKDLKPFESRIFQLANEREKTQLALKSTSVSVDGQSLLLVVVQDIHRELDEKETDSWVKLIRVLTHEIMNTITPITSISESILKYFKPQRKTSLQLNESHVQSTVKGLEVIKEQGGDLMEFVQSYRSFLSLPKPDKSMVSAHKLLEKVKVLMNQENQSVTVDFNVITEPMDLELFIDEKQISQILVNLSKNALQSLNGQENGRIRILAGSTNQEKNISRLLIMAQESPRNSSMKSLCLFLLPKIPVQELD